MIDLINSGILSQQQVSTFRRKMRNGRRLYKKEGAYEISFGQIWSYANLEDRSIYQRFYVKYTNLGATQAVYGTYIKWPRPSLGD